MARKVKNIVDMNNAAIDQGINAIVAVNVPEAWANLADTAGEAQLAMLSLITYWYP